MAPMKLTTYQHTTELTKARLTKIRTQVDELAKLETPLTQAQTRALSTYLSEVTRKRDEFETNLLRLLESLGDSDLDRSALSKDQDDINDSHVYLTSMIESMLPTPAPPSPSVHSVEEVTHTLASQVRLPQLELKHFNGDPNLWVGFISLFDSAVHKNPSVPNSAKFQYLRGVLSGEPLLMIQSLDLNSANYLIAYQLLRDRYHNPRRLQAHHLNSLLDLPQVTASSPKSIRAFLNWYTEHTQALRALECDIVSASNPLFAAVLLRKMDSDLRKKLENYRSLQELAPHSLPEVQDIAKFLNQECSLLEDSSLYLPQTSSKAHHSHPHAQRGVKSGALNTTRPQVSLLSTSVNDNSRVNPSCFICNHANHRIYVCDVFKNMIPSQRYQAVKDNKRCVNCLGAHHVKECQSKSSCFTCHKKHHSSLHFSTPPPTSVTHSTGTRPTSQSNSTQNPQNKDTLSSGFTGKTSSNGNSSKLVALTSQGCPSTRQLTHSTVLLGTTLVHLTAANGHSQVFRGLIDSGSTSSFISEHAAQSLNAPRLRSNLQITGISGSSSHTKGFLRLGVSTLSGDLITASHAIHILEKISVPMPRATVTPEVVQRAQAFLLADPSFHLSGRVDVLLGADLFPLLLTQQLHSLGPQLPTMLGTRFGFVVVGQSPCLPSFDSSVTSNHAISLLSTSDIDLHSSLQRFWHQEEPPLCNSRTSDELECDKHFSNTHSRDPNGRYIVRLPFKVTPPDLGNSKLSAERRLHALERKQSTHPSLHAMYRSFLNEYEELGHMVKANDVSLDSPHYFLPHHSVSKDTSSTTKLRVVFDASAKTSSGLSLNDNLFVGPKLQTDICDIQLHFRSHPIVVSCDIRQMYRQIRVHEDDQKYQLILWRSDINQKIDTYKLTTVTYGVCTAPYLAIRTLRQLALDEGAAYPAAAEVLQNQAYMDDIIFGADNHSDAIMLRNQLVELLKLGGFELRKWISNSAELLTSLPSDHLETPTFLQDSGQPRFSVLGIQWTPSTDSFSYKINLPSTAPTKRSALSVIARIYDPCGYVAPCIMLAKCFMQLLWTSGLSWDAPLPQELAEKWMTFISHLSALSSLHIPRAIHLAAPRLELHGFADASECGYGAVVYLRSEDPANVQIRLLLAKTRVAPLKRVTLPRLELCAALLLAKLAAHCLSLFSSRISSKNTFLWSDSMVALTWLRTPSYRLKTYVANRVAQAQELMPSHCWRFVPGQDNPADCASRGLLASQLLDHPLWWTGPQWLSLPPDNWPDIIIKPQDLDASEEIKKTPIAVLHARTVVEEDSFTRYSSWSKLLHVHAYVRRFIFNLRNPTGRHGPLSTSELQEAHNSIIRTVQQSCFSDDINALKQKKPPSQKTRRLTPFLDDNGLLRVGGRLDHSPIASEAKHPLLLPHRHHVVDLLVDHWHLRQLHAGPLATQAALCQRYWILAARSVIRSRIHRCLTCFRQQPKHTTPSMAPLPKVRVTPSRAFVATGMDYCGPFPCQVHRLRGNRQVKVYLCLFICMVTKAIHIEVVTDLSTEAFLAALTRFMSRRGFCSDIYSDCGTNFVGADAELRKIISSLRTTEGREKVHNFTSNNEVKFHFNPPAAPHFGGLWEGAVKSAKFHLRRVIGKQILTLPEFITLSTQVEAMLNSRPLTPLSSDPSDLTALTPGHFLIGAPLTALPQADLSNAPLSRLSRFRLVQALQQNFWKRWQKEYLHTQLQRPKWTHSAKNLQVGDLVLMQLPSPPLSWPLARIVDTHPGADGVVRTVTLKTSSGTLKRPAVKVFPLPMEQ